MKPEEQIITNQNILGVMWNFYNRIPLDIIHYGFEFVMNQNMYKLYKEAAYIQSKNPITPEPANFLGYKITIENMLADNVISFKQRKP